MVIQAKVVSKERQQAIAQGRVLSASSTRPAAAKLRQGQTRSPSSSSTSSSSSDESDASTPPRNIPPPKASKSHMDPLEDHAAYAKRVAKQEWLYATGQAGGVPTPPPKPAAANTLASPARKPPVRTVVEPETKPATPPPQSVPLKSSPAPAVTPASDAARVTPAKVPAATSPKKVNNPASPSNKDSEAATAVTVVPPTPLPSELVTDEEERLHPGRREYLRMLELLSQPEAEKPRDPSEGEASDPPPPPPARRDTSRETMTLPQLTRHHYNQMYQAWLDADSDFPFLAYDHWEKAEAMAIIDMAGGSIDPGEMHQLFRQKSTRDAPSEDPNIRFAQCVNILEDLVVSDSFERKVHRFLHTHHKAFVASMPARAKGEYQHADHEVFTKYGEMMEALILGELRRRVAHFDEMEFFDMLFQSDSVDDEGQGTSGSALSFALWEVILSFLKFESFCELMDEYIAVHYGVADTRGDTKARSVVGSLRKSPPPSAATTASTTSQASKPMAATSSKAKPPTPSVAKRPAVGAVVPSSAKR